jgi:hypothetical protein
MRILTRESREQTQFVAPQVRHKASTLRWNDLRREAGMALRIDADGAAWFQAGRH